MPPADDQQNVNPVDAQPQGMPPAMPSADGGQAPMQPTVVSPTTGPSDDMSTGAVAAPGFGSMPDSPAPAGDAPAAAAPSPFDVPSVPADVPPAAPAADVPPVPPAPAMGDVPSTAPDVPADTPDAGDAPTFPPAA